MVPETEMKTNMFFLLYIMSRLYIVTLFIYLYAEYIMRNARLDEAQARIKIARIHINNLRYADDTTIMAQSNGELRVS